MYVSGARNLVKIGLKIQDFTFFFFFQNWKWGLWSWKRICKGRPSKMWPEKGGIEYGTSLYHLPPPGLYHARPCKIRGYLACVRQDTLCQMKPQQLQGLDQPVGDA